MSIVDQSQFNPTPPGTRTARRNGERIAETVHGVIGATFGELPFIPKPAKLV